MGRKPGIGTKILVFVVIVLISISCGLFNSWWNSNQELGSWLVIGALTFGILAFAVWMYFGNIQFNREVDAEIRRTAEYQAARIDWENRKASFILAYNFVVTDGRDTGQGMAGRMLYAKCDKRLLAELKAKSIEELKSLEHEYMVYRGPKL